MRLNTVWIRGIIHLKESSYLTSNKAEIAVCEHTPRFTPNVLGEQSDGMFKRGAFKVTQWVFEKVSCFNIDKEKCITVTSDSRIGAIYDIVMKDITKTSWSICGMLIPTSFGQRCHLTMVTNRVTP